MRGVINKILVVRLDSQRRSHSTPSTKELRLYGVTITLGELSHNAFFLSGTL